MSQLLLLSDVIKLLEEKRGIDVWNKCGITEMGLISDTEFPEIMIMVYDKKDMKKIKTILKDIVNVKEIMYTGHIKPLAM